jgi:ABC-2 type transport system permease protein
MRIRRFVRHTLTVARREFMTAVTQPAFLVFLLSPMIILVASLATGGAIDSARTQSMSKRTVVMLSAGAEARIARAVDARLRDLATTQERAPLRTEPPGPDPAAQARALLADPDADVRAVLYGAMQEPRILRTPDAAADERYLAQIAIETLQAIRAEQMSSHGGRTFRIVRPEVVVSRPEATSATVMEGLGAAAIVLVFMATYLLSSHIATGFAEERSSKIVEILASSASLESVFFGKLVGELAVATLFTAFWIVVLIGVALAGALPSGGDGSLPLTAATGGLFPILFLVYFVMSYLISSCSILGLASLASTPRGAAIMVMPFSLLQFGMMSLSTYVAMKPETPLFWIAAAIPYSSPLIMVSRAATSPSLSVHLVGIAWQLMWVVTIVRLAAGAFRRGALGGGHGLSFGRGRS